MSLSPRQLAIVELASQGLSNKEIALRLGCAEETVKGHLKWVFIHLNARNRAHAVATALREGLVA